MLSLPSRKGDNGWGTSIWKFMRIRALCLSLWFDRGSLMAEAWSGDPDERMYLLVDTEEVSTGKDIWYYDHIGDDAD